MQAVISRTSQRSRAYLIGVLLIAGVVLGGLGGYLVGDLGRPATGAQVVSQPKAPRPIAAGVARHAASERVEAGSAPIDFATSVARHEAQERADANGNQLAAPSQAVPQPASTY
jgi:hypothetical protein